MFVTRVGDGDGLRRARKAPGTFTRPSIISEASDLDKVAMLSDEV
jgi:hypothetical protein